jgi:hypothetical protein
MLAERAAPHEDGHTQLLAHATQDLQKEFQNLLDEAPLAQRLLLVNIHAPPVHLHVHASPQGIANDLLFLRSLVMPRMQLLRDQASELFFNGGHVQRQQLLRQRLLHKPVPTKATPRAKPNQVSNLLQPKMPTIVTTCENQSMLLQARAQGLVTFPNPSARQCYSPTPNCRSIRRLLTRCFPNASFVQEAISHSAQELSLAFSVHRRYDLIHLHIKIRLVVPQERVGVQNTTTIVQTVSLRGSCLLQALQQHAGCIPLLGGPHVR